MSSLKRKGNHLITLWCWLFMLPTVVLYIMFQGWPILSSIYYSTLDWSGLSSKARFVGLNNFTALFHDDLFWNAFRNSFKYMLISVPILLCVSLLLAVLLNDRFLKGRTAFRTMYFLPVVTTASIIGIIMVFIWGPMGPINEILRLVGVPNPINWLGRSETAMTTVVLIGVWKDAGIYMIYWLAALQSVPQDVLEAAGVDGATKSRTFFSITLPLILPIGGVIAILSIINSLKVFDIVQTMTEGGPFFATDVVATFVYRTAYSSSTGMPRLGYASAAAMLFGLVIITIGVVLSTAKSTLNRRRSI